jgi:nitroreductase
METLEAIKKRRSIKNFDPTYKLNKNEIVELISLAMLSPTSYNIQHWKFVIVQDKNLKEQIAKVAWNQPQVTESSILVVVCADLKAWEKFPGKKWRNAPKEVQDFMIPSLINYYDGNEQLQRDEALRSTGMASQTLMLAAKSLGYDSCPMVGLDFEAVAKLINLPEDYIISNFVAIGKGTKEPWPRAGQLSLDDVMVQNHFL